MKKLNKIIITEWNDKILTCRINGNEITQFYLEEKQRQSLLNNIYIGRVKNIVKNINSAFVDLGNGQMSYYSLTENKKHNFTSTSTTRLKEGDEIIVQVIKDAVKTKDPVVSSNLSFTGRYCVLTSGKTMIGFSNKITDSRWKEEVKYQLLPLKDDTFGVIIRTNAANVDIADIKKEFLFLREQYQTLMATAPYRTCYNLLFQEPPAYIASIRDTYITEAEQIITDNPSIYDDLKQYLSYYNEDQVDKLSLYQEPMISLLKVYNLERELNRALEKKVWLKSGGYLVIEPTEALVVIDVNTGKYAGKKNLAETILKINLEAAQMIGRQLRLRNLSGIIIIDFIDMEKKEDQELLVNQLTEIVSKDPVKTTVLGMTQLNLVEVTRKKIRKPLHEQLLSQS